MKHALCEKGGKERMRQRDKQSIIYARERLGRRSSLLIKEGHCCFTMQRKKKSKSEKLKKNGIISFLM